MNEKAIVERLESLERKIEPITESAKAITELREQLAPRVNEAVSALILELVDVEGDFQLEDLAFFSKKLLRNIKNLTYALDQLESVIDFAKAVEPLLKGTVPQLIIALDELEQKGMFKLFTDVPSKIDFRNAQDVGMFGLLGALSDPEVKTGLGVLLELTRGLSALKVKDQTSVKKT